MAAVIALAAVTDSASVDLIDRLRIVNADREPSIKRVGSRPVLSVATLFS